MSTAAQQQAPRISIPTSIPLIGTGPSPEQRAQEHMEISACGQLWPLAAFPMGPQTPKFWMWKTMLHEYGLKAMELLGDQLAAKSRTPEEILALCKRAWLIAQGMMQTCPVGMSIKKAGE